MEVAWTQLLGYALGCFEFWSCLQPELVSYDRTLG